ncbi:MAG: M67 family metallopeptidase [Verrucomicrobia bacterium]|nr:M67 family metallopeptidase [Verrucomicrobiota bacterium]MDA1085576.1 M67 family metallopeptidase [Verrucomicrobiota bacterium]
MSRVLHIPRAMVEELKGVAEAGAPLEVCALLAGTGNRIERVFPMTNADASADHFTMVPAEQFAAIKAMRTDRLHMLAVWHSHPATAARMSEEDLRLAYTPDVAYMITSLAVADDESLCGYDVEDGIPRQIQIVIED